MAEASSTTSLSDDQLRSERSEIAGLINAEAKQIAYLTMHMLALNPEMAILKHTRAFSQDLLRLFSQKKKDRCVLKMRSWLAEACLVTERLERFIHDIGISLSPFEEFGERMELGDRLDARKCLMEVIFEMAKDEGETLRQAALPIGIHVEIINSTMNASKRMFVPVGDMKKELENSSAAIEKFAKIDKKAELIVSACNEAALIHMARKEFSKASATRCAE